jgi:hypothetical protein
MVPFFDYNSWQLKKQISNYRIFVNLNKMALCSKHKPVKQLLPKSSCLNSGLLTSYSSSSSFEKKFKPLFFTAKNLSGKYSKNFLNIKNNICPKQSSFFTLLIKHARKKTVLSLKSVIFTNSIL